MVRGGGNRRRRRRRGGGRVRQCIIKDYLCVVPVPSDLQRVRSYVCDFSLRELNNNNNVDGRCESVRVLVRELEIDSISADDDVSCVRCFFWSAMTPRNQLGDNNCCFYYYCYDTDRRLG